MLRFLLAFLYSHANGGDRSSFDGYWKAAIKPQKEYETREAAAKRRGIDMRRHAGSICQAVGEEPKNIHDRFWDELTREAYAGRGETVRIMK